ncbi:unnamed protein product [Didymodactylos carnosus]|uniref:Helicase C-terminal domain-containing protein n=1 Tax=Didymodactylos carnosus TaxID=1234261 RepID=A0A815DSX3_9BILA|nr:unnamed protein product [Didymodactylos carnosus]CAF4129334.1 unnamed protein product [Didymodactylos carnosus]
MNYFKHYNNLRGITDTNSGKEERELLKLESDVDRFKLPCFKKYRFKCEKIEEIVCKNIQNYELLLNSKNSIYQRRTVLIVCENIVKFEKNSSQVRKEFQYKGNKIYIYDRTYRKFEKNQLNCADIIIATNITGRGTDLDINQFPEKNGGLHVILTYIPNDLRV